MVGEKYEGLETTLPNLAKPAAPPAVEAGGHGGSHGYLGHEFVMSILENRQPLVNVTWALNMTVAGIVAHQSALKNGELMKIRSTPDRKKGSGLFSGKSPDPFWDTARCCSSSRSTAVRSSGNGAVNSISALVCGCTNLMRWACRAWRPAARDRLRGR